VRGLLCHVSRVFTMQCVVGNVLTVELFLQESALYVMSLRWNCFHNGVRCM